MARIFLYTVIALLLGASMGLLMKDDPGYVLVAFRGWTFEATLGAMLLALLAIFIFIFTCLWLLVLLNPLKLLRRSTWRNMFGSRTAEAASVRGVRQLLIGNWQEAYRLLVQHAPRVANPQLNYLLAALAASERGDELGWRFCLDQATKLAGSEDGGVRVLRAMLELRAGHVREAQVMLQALRRAGTDGPLLLRLLKDIYVRQGDWQSLAVILPQLEKQSVLGEEEARTLGESVQLWRLERASGESFESLQEVWLELPRPLRGSEVLVHRYLECLLRHGRDAEAASVLAQFLKRNWSDNLVRRVGLLNAADPQPLLQLLEGSLGERPDNAVLLLTLGRLSQRSQQWSKARDYFEQAARRATEPDLTVEACAELARLLAGLGEEEASLDSYRRALQLTAQKYPELPLPQR